MKINTWSTLLSLIFTLLSFIVGSRIVIGKFQASDIVISLIIFLPIFVITFSIFYLLVSHILNKIQEIIYVRPFIKNDLNKKSETESKYSLPMVYRCLGILLLVSPIVLYYSDHRVLMIMIILFFGSYYLKTPYKIEIEENAYRIFLLTGKQNIKRDNVRAVKLGVFNNRVDFGDDFIYLSHFLTNVSSLTKIFAEKTGTQNINGNRWAGTAKNEDSTIFWIYRTIILMVFSILSSILGVVYLINYVQKM